MQINVVVVVYSQNAGLVMNRRPLVKWIICQYYAVLLIQHHTSDMRVDIQVDKGNRVTWVHLG